MFSLDVLVQLLKQTHPNVVASALVMDHCQSNGQTQGSPSESDCNGSEPGEDSKVVQKFGRQFCLEEREIETGEKTEKERRTNK